MFFFRAQFFIKVTCAMSNRTFVCLSCKKLNRKDQSVKTFYCPICHKECIQVHKKLHVPAPKKKKKWDKFWSQYLYELRQIEEFNGNKNIKRIELPLLNQVHIRDTALVAGKRKTKWHPKMIQKI